MEKLVRIMRGISGSGKTFLTKKNHPETDICSANDYFTDAEGNYNFDKNKLPEAHQFCKDKFRDALEQGVTDITIDNTNIKLWEFEDYIKLAQAYSYTVEVIHIQADPVTAHARNIHGVPMQTVRRTYEQFEPYPGEKIIESKE